MRLLPLLSALLVVASLAAPAKSVGFSDGYAEFVSCDLTGLSSAQRVRIGTAVGRGEAYFSLGNEWYDTTATNLAFRAAQAGAGASVGVRVWDPSRRGFATVSYGVGIGGANTGRPDFRYGVAGSSAWEKGTRRQDLYGEVFYVGRAKDTYAAARYRTGKITHRDARGWLWRYVVLQSWATAGGAVGTENRAEAGAGLGYMYRGTTAVGLEYRVGHSYSGTITERTYTNPTFVLAASF